jgi:hypothetical protein
MNRYACRLAFRRLAPPAEPEAEPEGAAGAASGGAASGGAAGAEMLAVEQVRDRGGLMISASFT